MTKDEMLAEAERLSLDQWVEFRNGGIANYMEIVAAFERVAASARSEALEAAARICGNEQRGWTPGYEAGPRIRALAAKDVSAPNVNETDAEAAIRKMSVEVADPLGGVLRSLLNMLDDARKQGARLADKMRSEFPMNKHAQEWADWIDRETIRALAAKDHPHE